MSTAEAHILTEHPSRYLVQLSRHAQQAHRLRHRPRAHGGGTPQPPPKVQHVEWSQTRGIINFGWGQCTMQATRGTLTVRAEATGEENLKRIQDIITADIERFGKRDHLTVTWQQPGTPTGQSSEAS
jgi:hypothetical protein